MSLIYGYRVQFIQEERMGMMLTRDNLVPSEALDPHQAKMLAYNRVPHFLRLDIREVDLELSFFYDISGKRMLKQVLRSMRMTSVQYFEWMLQLVRILENCRAYMLHPDHVLLHEECVFVDEQAANGGLYVAYLPLLEPLRPRAGMDGLRRLGLLLSSHVAKWNGDGFQRLVQCLSQEDNSLVDVRNLLQSLVAGTSGMEAQRPIIQSIPEGMASLSPPDADFNCSKKPEGDNEQSAYTHEPAASGVIRTATGVPVPGEAETVRREDEDAVLETKGTPSGKSYYSAGGAAIITAALAWRYIYMDNPALHTLLISVGISVGAVALGAAWISGIWARILGMLTRRESEAPSMAGGAEASSPWQSHSGCGLLRPECLVTELQTRDQPAAAHILRLAAERDCQPGEYASFPRVSGNESTTPEGMRMDTFYTGLSKHTSVLDSSGSEATVVLGEERGTSTGYREGGGGAPYLQRLDGSPGAWGMGIPKEAAAVVDRIPLVFPFVIGRSELGVQWRETGVGVSKHHWSWFRPTTAQWRSAISDRATERSWRGS